MEGWISLHRRFQEHWLWQEKRKFSKAEAWIDLLFMANHKDKKFLLGNELIEVKRGSLVTSELKLMERWGWSKEKLRKFLKMLEQDGMIIKKSDRKKTTITIVNYDVFQNPRPQQDHEQTTSRPQTDHEPNTNNNIDDDEWWEKLVETETERPDVAEVRDYFIQKIGRFPTIDDLDLMQQLLDKGYTVEMIKRGIDHAIATYRPRYNGDKINSFLYCAKATQTLYSKQNKPSGGWKPRPYVEPATPNVITEDTVAKYRALMEERMKKKKAK